MAEGDKIVRELFVQQRYQVQEVFALESWLAEQEQILQQNQIPFTIVNEQELRLISQLSTPNQVVALVGIPERANTINWNDNWSLYLAGLQDPGNVGTILRIADWFGIPRVVAGPGTVELYNAKVLQATMGAFLRVQWIEETLDNIQKASPDLSCWAADMGGEDIFTLDVPTSGLLVIGNEGQGLSPELIQKADKIASISAPAGSGAESLNAAVATGILCAAIRRGVR